MHCGSSQTIGVQHPKERMKDGVTPSAGGLVHDRAMTLDALAAEITNGTKDRAWVLRALPRHCRVPVRTRATALLGVTSEGVVDWDDRDERAGEEREAGVRRSRARRTPLRICRTPREPVAFQD